MDFLLLLLSESLKKRKPQLDLGGADRKVLGIAVEDLKNYLKFHWRLMGKETAESELRERVRQFFYERTEELEEFVDLWASMWMRKWNERVKLIIGGKGHPRLKNIHEFSGGRSGWRHLGSWRGIEEMAIEALIRNGEICGTAILAESLVKPEIGPKRYKGDLLVVANSLFKRARRLSESRGPLMFVRIDKRFWNVMRQDGRRKIY